MNPSLTFQVQICYLIFTPWSLSWELRKVKLRSKRSNVTIKIISTGFIILNSIVFYLLKFSTVSPNCFSQYSVVADYKIFYLIFIFLHSKYVHISRKSSHKIGVLAQQSTVYIPKFFLFQVNFDNKIRNTSKDRQSWGG